MSSTFATDLLLKNVKLCLVRVYQHFIISKTYSSEYSHAHNFIHIGRLSYKYYPFSQSASVACELILTPMKKWHLYTCSYAYFWCFRHTVLLSLRGSNMLFWKIAALLGKQRIWSIFAPSPLQYVCSNWWHSTMKSSSFRSLHMAQFLVHSFLMVKLFPCLLLHLGWEQLRKILSRNNSQKWWKFIFLPNELIPHLLFGSIKFVQFFVQDYLLIFTLGL